MKKLILSTSALILTAGLSLAQSQHVVQTAPDRVVAEHGKYVCFFVGPINEQVFISCKVGQGPATTTVVAFFIGDCHTGSYNGIGWSLCRPKNNEFDWDIRSGTLDVTGQLF